MNLRQKIGVAAGIVVTGLCSVCADIVWVTHRNGEIYSEYTPDAREAQALGTKLHMGTSANYILNDADEFNTIRDDLENKMDEYVRMESRYDELMARPGTKQSIENFKDETKVLVYEGLLWGIFGGVIPMLGGLQLMCKYGQQVGLEKAGSGKK